jgi:hypothetical protein
MEADDLLKEGRGDGRGGVGVAQCDEVRIFGEAIDHCQDYQFPVRLQKSFNEVHGSVLPYHCGNVEWLEEAGRVQVLGLMALANRALADEVADEVVIVRHEERGAQLMKSLLDTLMAHVMGLE